eukprot:GHVS01029345.1.p1 GENE.GHVS01029345.1~~GHVS01029345.1.p1  ORF type:complete len:511 (+),score=87.74 GHVS01029345.1:191-1723(+)
MAEEPVETSSSVDDRRGSLLSAEAKPFVPAEQQEGTVSAPAAEDSAPEQEEGGHAVAGEEPKKEEEETVIPKHNHLVDSSEAVVLETVDQTEGQPITKWEELKLDEDLLRGVYEMGFARPSKIQKQALPLIMCQRGNLIAQAHNGSGKTAAFTLAMLGAVNKNNKDPQCICLCPTRELAMQTMKVIREIGKFTKITTYLMIPQCPRYDNVIGAQILVGTPGKTFDMLKRKYFPTASMSTFVLDEADELIDRRNSMAPQIQNIRKFFSPDLQVLLFSATFPEEVKEFAKEMVPRANKVHLKKEELTLSTITQFYRICKNDVDKKTQLADLYCSMTIGQSIIFVNSRKLGFELSMWMKDQGHAVTLICGSQSQGAGADKMDHDMRDKIMEEFRNGETKVLITTDVLCRGIDVPQVTLVINYDLPRTYNNTGGNYFGAQSQSVVNMETYIHRIGRTGRFGLLGISVSFVLPHEMTLIQEVKDFYQCSIEELPEDPEEIDEMLRNLRKKKKDSK